MIFQKWLCPFYIEVNGQGNKEIKSGKDNFAEIIVGQLKTSDGAICWATKSKESAIHAVTIKALAWARTAGFIPSKI